MQIFVGFFRKKEYIIDGKLFTLTAANAVSLPFKFQKRAWPHSVETKLASWPATGPPTLIKYRIAVLCAMLFVSGVILEF